MDSIAQGEDGAGDTHLKVTNAIWVAFKAI